MELWFLGTGAGVPSPNRNVSAMAMTWFQERGSLWLFDCGEATQQQVMKTPLSLAKLEVVFLTHLHGDHLFGLPGVLSSRSYSGPGRPLTVYGPRGLRAFVRAVLAAGNTHLTYPLEVRELRPGHVFTDDHCTVTCALLDHGVPSLGYRIVERDLPGHLDVAALERAGVPAGPLYGRLKQGLPVTLEDGRVLPATEFVDPPQPGLVAAVLGDTRPTAAAVELARGADVLVHEATFASAEAHLAAPYGHSTAADAARTARAAGARRLVLNHISARYASTAKLLAEAQAIFPNAEVAEDFSRIALTRHHRGG